MKFNTKVLHGSYRAEFHAGSTLAPVAQVSAVEQWAAKRENSSLHHKAPFCGFFSALFYTDWALEESRGKKIVGKSRQEDSVLDLFFNPS